MKPEYIGAILFYSISLFSVFKGAIYHFLGWKYTTQVKAQAINNLLFSDPIGLLTVWISWKVTAIFFALLGTYMLYYGYTQEEKIQQ